MNNIVERIDERTFIIRDGFVYCFLLIGEEKAALIDSGVSGMDIPAIAREVLAEQGAPDLPLILINTHGDGDHVACNGAFEEFYMHLADYENCGVAKRFSGKCLPLTDNMTIDLGSRPLTILEIPGHTAGSVAILDVTGRRIITGDSIQDGQVFMFGAHRRPAQFADSMAKIAAMKDRFDTILASHGTAILPNDYVETVIAVWQQVQNGELQPTPQDVHGNMIQSYVGEGCGFYC